MQKWTGKKVNKFTIISEPKNKKGITKSGFRYYLKIIKVSCICGNKSKWNLSCFLRRKPHHCHYCENKTRRCDLKNKKFFHWKVIKFVGINKQSTTLWLCKCVCGNTKVLSNPVLKQGHSKSCGCKRSENRLKGKKHKWFNPNLSNKERLEYRNEPDQKLWSKLVKQRDGFCCQKCGCRKYKNNLIAHHIKCYFKYPKLRYKINNGITLCRKCHTRFHHINRKKNINRKLLNDFLNENNQ